MGFFDNYGVGANAFVQNMVGAQNANRQHALELQKLAQQKQLQEAQAQQAQAHAQYYLAQIEEQKRKAAQEGAFRQKMQGAFVPGMDYESAYGQVMGDPQFVGPPTPRDTGRMGGLMSTKFDQDKALQAALQFMEPKELVEHVTKSKTMGIEKILPNIDKLSDKTLKIFSQLYGVDLEAYRKPEKDETPNELKIFESVTGYTKEKRGTPEYQAAYRRFTEKAKEVNTDNAIEAILAGMPEYADFIKDPEIRAKAWRDYATIPGMADKVRKKAAEYTKSKAPDIYNVIPGFQTAAGGPVKINARGGGVMPAGGDIPIQPTPTAADIKEARSQTSIDAVLDEVDKVFTSAEPHLPQTAMDRVTGYPKRVAGSTLQSTPELTLAQSISDGFAAKFARAAGEVGTMTEGDIKRADMLKPTIHDTKAVRDGKMRQAKELYLEIFRRGRRQENPLGSAVKTKGSGNSNIDLDAVSAELEKRKKK